MSGRWDPELDAAKLAAESGIHCIPVPTPFLVGPVNLYLIDDDPLTLVDTGPNSGLALEALAAGLRGLGHEPESIARVILTHQHMDHIGLAGVVSRVSGAEILAIEGAQGCMGRYAEWMAADDAFAEQVMARHGIPDDVRLALQAVSASFRGWGAPVEPTRLLVDGDTVDFAARSFSVHHRPGHSPSDTIFFDEARGILLGGDHLLAEVSSNPLIARPLDWSLPGEPAAEALARPHQVLIYLESLRQTAAMEGIEVVLGGHGPAFDDPARLVADREGLHERRASKIEALLAEGPSTAHQLAERMWGNVAVTQAYLTLSEVLGHLDLLVERGRVKASDGEKGPVEFELAP